MRYISENLAQFVATAQFLRLDSEQLSSLLHSNFPINMSESEVLAAAAAWVEEEPRERQGLAVRVVEGVRLGDIPTRDIMNLLHRPGLKGVREQLAALERISPLRQSDTYKMVNSR